MGISSDMLNIKCPSVVLCVSLAQSALPLLMLKDITTSKARLPASMITDLPSIPSGCICISMIAPSHCLVTPRSCLQGSLLRQPRQRTRPEAQGRIRLVRPLDALLQHLPKPRHIHAARYPDALRGRRELGGNSAARLRRPGTGIVVRPLGLDGDGEALAVLDARGALGGVIVVEGNLVRGADEDDGDGEGVVQRRAGGDAEDVAVGLGEEHEELDEHLAEGGLGLRRLAVFLVLGVPWWRGRLAVQEERADLFGGEDLVAEIQRYDGRLGGQWFVGEDERSGLRVGYDVELGPGGVVAYALPVVDAAQGDVGEAAAKDAAHDAEALDVGHEGRVLLEEGGDVGEGPGGDEPSGVGRLGEEGGRHGVNGGLCGVGGDERLGEKGGAVKTRLAVDVGRSVHGWTGESMGGAAVYGDVVVFTDGGEDGGRIGGGLSGNCQL